MKSKLSFGMAALAVAVAAFTSHAQADERGTHPAYRHAVADLLAARDQIEHRRPEDGAVLKDEEIASSEIAAALADMQRANEMDGKHEPLPPPDVAQLPDGRLHAAVALLQRARADVDGREDDPRSRPSQSHALEHIDSALRAATAVMKDRRRS